MKNTTLSAIELYMRRVFKVVVLIVPMAGLCAGLTFTLLKLLGFYSDVSWAGLIVLDGFCALYTVIGHIIVHRCEDKNGYLKKNAMKTGKIYLVFVGMIQWNLISYIIPSRDFWAYSIFFVMFAAVFLDHKFLLCCYVCIYGSVIVSWIIKGDPLMPVHDDIYIAELILRAVLMVLASALLWLITYLVETRLVFELEKMADYDTLTMLHNRRSMEKAINNMAESGELSLLMCDLDDFKRVNDTYGHKCGDEVLRYVANIISRDVGKGDLVFRYGGEEIVVAVRGSLQAASAVGERVRSDIESGCVSCDGKDISVTVTIGAVQFEPDMTVDSLVKSADEKLYIGKHNGKNQVVI